MAGSTMATRLAAVIAFSLYWTVPASAQIGGFFMQNGQTRLLGSSFGLLGVNETFDYVVVGAGTAGLTLAKRLAEDPSVSVAVIEAGGFYEIENSNVSQIEAYDTKYSTAAVTDVQPLIDWGIITTPQPQLGNRPQHYAAGKCFGGTSGRHYLIYQRGTNGSYQQWADAVDDQTFTFDKILPYFQKSVNFTPPNYAKRGPGSFVEYDPAAYSPTGGPLKVSYSNFWQKFSPYVSAGFSKLGLQEIDGLNSGSLLGYSEFALTLNPDAAIRDSSETSFMQEGILQNPNLIFYTKTYAQQVLFDSKKTATGVRVQTENVQYTISARKEVIVSAGSFRSPQLLMTSGIGPNATLQQFKIPPVQILEGVGQNMQDQPLLSMTYQINVSSQSELNTNPAYAAAAVTDLLTNQTGPLESGSFQFVGWEKLPQDLRGNLSNSTLAQLAAFPADWPELEILPLSADNSPTAATDKGDYAAVSIAVLTTSSRGNVTISSIDTRDNPIISPNWLITNEDRELAVQAFKRARQIAASFGITTNETFPGASVQTDDQILAYLEKTLGPIHHASCTNSMGVKSDPMAVVDSQGRVFGVSGLRVVDVSAWPLLPPGHTQSTAYMLAEKIAAQILGSTNNSTTSPAVTSSASTTSVPAIGSTPR